MLETTKISKLFQKLCYLARNKTLHHQFILPAILLMLCHQRQGSKHVVKMPNRCVAISCSNTRCTEGVSVFHFPKDECIKRKSIAQVRRTRNKWTGPTMHSVVCTGHFNVDCFVEDVKLHNLFGLNRPMKIEFDAVPTIFKRKATSGSSSRCSEPASKRENVLHMKSKRGGG